MMIGPAEIDTFTTSVQNVQIVFLIQLKQTISAIQFWLTIKYDIFQGFTPIHWAAFMGNVDAVRLLAENGADATAMSKLWYTALSAPFLNQDNSLNEGGTHF